MSDAYFLPATNIQTLAQTSELDFFDSQTVQLARPIPPLEAWRITMSRPMPFLKLAIRVRDAISSRFGVKPIGRFSARRPDCVRVGDRLAFYAVEHVAHDVLTLTERDRHLDVMTCITTRGCSVTITSSVRIHNTFGRVYMIPFGPAHKLIVRQMLRHLVRKVGRSGAPRHHRNTDDSDDR